MDYSPSELLLRSGLIGPEQLSSALELQQSSGASLLECLIQIEAFEERTLAAFYHKQLMVPFCDEQRLAQAPASAIRLIPAEMASAFRVLPVSADITDALLLAMADPADSQAADEVASISGRFVMRAVAEAVVLKQAIERHYGVRLPVANLPKELPSTIPMAPQPIAPELPREREEPVVLLANVKRRGPQGGRRPAEVPTRDVSNGFVLRQSVTISSRDTQPGFFALNLPDPPLAALRASKDRDEITALVLDYLMLLARRTGFFVVRQGRLAGYDFRGSDLRVGSVRKITIPLTAPSLFRDVIFSLRPYRGVMPEREVHHAFMTMFGAVEGEVLIIPIVVRDRVVALVFTDRLIQPFPDAAVHAACREAGLAYERLLLSKRRR
jgi:hypothetical protein